MRKLSLLIALGALFCTASVPALADNGPAPQGVHVHWFAGTATAVSDSSISVGVLWTGPNDGSLNGQTVNVAVSTHTRINGPHHRPIALASITPGDLVALRAFGNDPATMTAVKIRRFCNCHWVGGTISSIGSSSFAVAVSRTGPYDTVLNGSTITLQANAYTVYLRGRSHGRLGFSDLQPGEGVGVIFAADGFFKAPGFNPATATFTAERVHVWANRQVPPPATDNGDSAGISVT
jgi:hypothetical protein